jgi:hypothetical protein
VSTEDTLIDELLHNARVSGNHVLERRMADLAIWYYKNKGSIPRDNLAARQAFLEKALWILLEIQALTLQRVRQSRPGSNLFVPNGMLVTGEDAKNLRFG